MSPENIKKQVINIPTPLDPELQDPDNLFQRDLPQVPKDQVDALRSYKIGRFAGPMEKVKRLILSNPNGDTLWERVEQTQFVQIIEQDGTVHMHIFDPKIHGEWEDIPPIEGITPAEFVSQLEGFGDEEIPQNQQFNNERKKHGGARKTSWPVGRNPKPSKLK
jgi:hypothetical protein